MSKLPKETVEQIYHLYLDEGMYQDAIAEKLGIDRITVIRNLKKYPDQEKIAAARYANRGKRTTKQNNIKYSPLYADILETFFSTSLTELAIAEKLNTTSSTVRKTLRQKSGLSEAALQDELRYRVNLAKAAKSVQKDIIDNGRYNSAKLPDNCTFPYKKGYMGEHSRVVCQNLGLTEIPEGYVVHHVNNDSKDNRFENLVLMTRSEHTSLHRRYYAKGVTTISKESTLKWVEARRQGASQQVLDDIVYSGQECSAADKAGVA